MSAKAVLSGMMKGLAILGLVVAIGCGREEREAKGLADEGNQRLATASATIKEMNQKYQINLLPMFPDMVDQNLATLDWNRFTPEQRQTIRKKLSEHVSNIGRIKEITNHKNISSGVDPRSLAMSGAFAQKYLSSLDAFNKAGGVSPRAMPVDATTAAERELRLVEMRELEAKVTASAAILKVSYSLSVEQAVAGESANRDWAKVEKGDLAKIKTRLQEFQANTERLVQLANEGIEVAELEKKKASGEAAGAYLMSIQAFESKQTVETKQTSESKQTSETKQGAVDPWPKAASETKQSSQTTQSSGSVATSVEQ